MTEFIQLDPFGLIIDEAPLTPKHQLCLAIIDKDTCKVILRKNLKRR